MEKRRTEEPDGVRITHYHDPRRDRDAVAVEIHRALLDEIDRALARQVRLQTALAKTRTLEGLMRRREMHVARRRKVRK